MVDPACGSGAFLITALRHLTFEFMRVLRRRYDLRLEPTAPDDAEVAAAILERNLFGVDINPLSVEIARLSLWLHTARAERPLSSLAATVRVGNSLVGADFRAIADRYPEGTLARVCPFDWRAEFADVFAAGGFDAVVGNPPYVKLQHFKRPYPETTEYLEQGTGDGPPFASTTTGNFDLYLPFIEQGLRLLNEGGRMGYIAPNLWPRLEYGEALRRLVVAGRHLERWIDFRSHQLFEEATIYTAIQIFTKAPSDRILLDFRGDGDLSKVDWADAADALDYAELDADGGEWPVAPRAMRDLRRRLAGTCRRLDDPTVTTAIFQGLITSADHIYHLRRLGRDRYLYQPPPVNKKKQPPIEVPIEDAIMKPLVSGEEAKRFVDASTDTYILFPYNLIALPRLFTSEEMALRFPQAWAWLRSHEQFLRLRQKWAAPRPDGKRGPFDDDRWFRFGRGQNLSKQEVKKLIVAQTVPSMRVCIDDAADRYLNNVRVNGILSTGDQGYVAGVMNSPTFDAMFRWSGKPKDGDYFEANDQFIAPLPVPAAAPADAAEVARIARELQAGYTRREALRRGLADRLGVIARRDMPWEWLFPEIQPHADIMKDAPNLDGRDRLRWAEERHAERVEAATARVDSLIRLSSTLDADYADGELRLTVDDAPALARIYLDPDPGRFAAAQWKVVALAFEPKGKDDAPRLLRALRRLALDADPAVRRQVIEREEELTALTRELRALEAELHAITCRLYELTPAERALVEGRG